MINFDALVALRQTADFDTSASQLFCLSVLKFWIEDKNRMKEHQFFIHFKRDKDEYFQLYQAFLTAQNNSNHIPHGPKFSSDVWIGFETGT